MQWPYGDICGIGPVGKGQGTEFNLTFRKGSGKKSETLKFSTEHRMELLTEALVRPAVEHPTGTPGSPHTHQVPEQQREHTQYHHDNGLIRHAVMLFSRP